MDEEIEEKKVMINFLRNGIKGMEEDLVGFMNVNIKMKKRII